MSHIAIVPSIDDCCSEVQTLATLIRSNGDVETRKVAPAARTLQSLIIDMFTCIERRAIHIWDIHLECTETLDWQMTVDACHVFDSLDFAAGMPLARKQLSDFAHIFQGASTIEFKPRMLVQAEPKMLSMRITNYEKYMLTMLPRNSAAPTPAARNQHMPIGIAGQSRKMRMMHMMDLLQIRQNKRFELSAQMILCNNAREEGSNNLYCLNAEHHAEAFDADGDIVTLQTNFKQNNIAHVYELFLRCQFLAGKQHWHQSVQNEHWEIVINGQHRLREIDFRNPEPGQLPARFCDFPHIFTQTVTVHSKPIFLAQFGNDMSRLGYTNMHRFRLYLDKVEMMKAFLFIEFDGSHGMHDNFEQIFHQLTLGLNNNTP